jgi:hypothetical protein
MTTDILDLPGWAIIAKTLEDDCDVLEAEYVAQPTACQKCGTIAHPKGAPGRTS